MKMHLKDWFSYLVVLAFILLFTYTGLAKLRDHHLFFSVVKKALGVEAAAIILSWTIPIIELALALLLFLNQYRRTALIGCACLMGVFTIYVGLFLLGWVKVPCSCGGIISSINWNIHLLLNLTLTLAAILAVKAIPASRTHNFFMRINRTSRTPVN